MMCATLNAPHHAWNCRQLCQSRRFQLIAGLRLHLLLIPQLGTRLIQNLLLNLRGVTNWLLGLRLGLSRGPRARTITGAAAPTATATATCTTCTGSVGHTANCYRQISKQKLPGTSLNLHLEHLC
jgi:hypothetical protein